MNVEILEMTLSVSDLEASARFYGAIGFAIQLCEEPGRPLLYDGGYWLQLFGASDKHPLTHIALGF